TSMTTASASGKVDGTSMGTIDRPVDEAEARLTNEQREEMDQKFRGAKEETANTIGGDLTRIGEAAGFAAALGTNTIALIANTAALYKSAGMKLPSAISGATAGGASVAAGITAAGATLAGVATGVVVATGVAINKGLEIGEERKEALEKIGYTPPTKDERDKIETKNEAFQNANPDMSSPEYWSNLTDIATVAREAGVPGTPEAIIDKIEVINNWNEDDKTIETVIKCNNKSEATLKEMNGG
ncbi:MAG: hypothetical protein DRJ15_17270, partial [Bacteroidetes bacterium]